MIKMPSRKWWVRFAVGLVWTPIAAEFFLRVFAPVPMLPRYIKAGSHGVRTNMPSQTYRHQTPEYTVEIRTNSQGMRADTDFSIAKPDGTKRIAILGDSFGMGYGVDLEDSSLFILQTQLEEALGCRVEIMNFSVSGFGPAEELIVLEAEALAFNPDLVIQYFCHNDPTDDVRAGLFAVSEDGIVKTNDTYLPAVKIREFLFSIPPYRWLAGESNLFNLARDRAGNLAKDFLAKARAVGGAEKKIPSKEEAVAPDSPPGITSRQTLSRMILKTIQDRCTEAGAEFLILSIPARRGRETFFDRFPYVDEESLPVVSPIDLFHAQQGEMLYWEKSHGHWTPLGCRLVADTFRLEILSRGLLGNACR